MKSGSTLEKVLASGKPAVTAELGPPMSADPHEVIKKAQQLKGYCDAANITDCQTAVVRISSIAAAAIALQHGLEPVMQMTCRDRNRIAIQADLLGAAALGLKNCLCLLETIRNSALQGGSRAIRAQRTCTMLTPASSLVSLRKCVTRVSRMAVTRSKYRPSFSSALHGHPWQTPLISDR